MTQLPYGSFDTLNNYLLINCELNPRTLRVCSISFFDGTRGAVVSVLAELSSHATDPELESQLGRLGIFS